MASKLISFRDSDLYDRIAAKAAEDGRSFPDTARELMRLGLDTADNRVLPDVAPQRCYGKTGLRRQGKSLYTVALRDDPLGQMREAGSIDNRQYECGMALSEMAWSKSTI
jgi:plasmid stability protein